LAELFTLKAKEVFIPLYSKATNLIDFKTLLDEWFGPGVGFITPVSGHFGPSLHRASIEEFLKGV
jgi:hypothetical protein